MWPFCRKACLRDTVQVRDVAGDALVAFSGTYSDGTLTVTYKVTPPDGFATQAFTHPGTVVLVPAHKGKVAFEAAKK